jgi:hypothetical protein
MVKDSSTDVEMKDAASPTKAAEATNGVEKEETKKDPELLTLEGRHFNKLSILMQLCVVLIICNIIFV